jgi:hypothetical protein
LRSPASRKCLRERGGRQPPLVLVMCATQHRASDDPARPRRVSPTKYSHGDLETHGAMMSPAEARRRNNSRPSLGTGDCPGCRPAGPLHRGPQPVVALPGLSGALLPALSWFADRGPPGTPSVGASESEGGSGSTLAGSTSAARHFLRDDDGGREFGTLTPSRQWLEDCNWRTGASCRDVDPMGLRDATLSSKGCT